MSEAITHAEAKARSLTRYISSEPCKRGHVGEFQTRLHAKTGKCVECARLDSVVRASPKSEPIAAPAAYAAPPAYEPDKSLHRDPATWISPERISACIDRIYGNAPRLGAASLAASEAA
jgi:hypothetical protein